MRKLLYTFPAWLVPYGLASLKTPLNRRLEAPAERVCIALRKALIVSPESIVPFAAAAAGTCLALYVLTRCRLTFVHVLFVVGLLLLSLEAVFSGLGARSILPDEILFWEKLRLGTIALIPSVWLGFCVTYARSDYKRHLAARGWLLVLTVVVPVAVLLVYHDDRLVRMPSSVPDGLDWVLPLGPAGKLVCITLLLGCVGMLVSLENTLRGAVGTVRWRIKFMVLGLAVVFGMRAYTTSHALLYSRLDTAQEWLNNAALIAGILLVAWSLRRGSLAGVDLYLSHRALYRSVSLFLIGIYLVAVGLVARLIGYLGGITAIHLKTFVIFVALLLLMMLVVSDRVRQRIKHVIALHLRRPQYDYREIWAKFSDRITSLNKIPDFCREVTNIMAETIEVLSATIWLADESRRRFVLGASTSLTESVATTFEQKPESFEKIVEGLKSVRLPVDLDRSKEPWVNELRKLNPRYFPGGGHCVCTPLSARGQLVGILVLGDRVNGLPYTLEEYELIKTIAGHVAATLLGFRLSERLLEARQLEAFQTMSTFFVHDLKNVVTTLSLILGNMPNHFDNPAFREDVLKAVSKCVERMNSLIERLGKLREGMELKRVPTDLNAIVRNTLDELKIADNLRVVCELRPLPQLSLDPSQIRKVLTNLVLNACAPTVGSTTLRIGTEAKQGWVCLSVADNGCGMSHEFVENSLFRPFRSTKKDGLGIGLFQSRMIVEAHGGKIEVETEEGVGTTFRVLLPVNGG